MNRTASYRCRLPERCSWTSRHPHPPPRTESPFLPPAWLPLSFKLSPPFIGVCPQCVTFLLLLSLLKLCSYLWLSLSFHTHAHKSAAWIIHIVRRPALPDRRLRLQRCKGSPWQQVSQNTRQTSTAGKKKRKKSRGQSLSSSLWTAAIKTVPARVIH